MKEAFPYATYLQTPIRRMATYSLDGSDRMEGNLLTLSNVPLGTRQVYSYMLRQAPPSVSG
jgi:hypothetical protein